MKYFIYDHDYVRCDYSGTYLGFDTVGDAADFLLNLPLTAEWPYMIGTDEEIGAFVFQGRVYREQSTIGKVMPPAVLVIDEDSL